MRLLIMPIVAIALWSIETIGAVQGDVTMKINSTHGLVNVGEAKVSPGDRVTFFKKQCVGGKLPVCKIEKVGGGRIVRVLNENYSEVETDTGVPFHEGYIIRTK